MVRRKSRSEGKIGRRKVRDSHDDAGNNAFTFSAGSRCLDCSTTYGIWFLFRRSIVYLGRNNTHGVG